MFYPERVSKNKLLFAVIVVGCWTAFGVFFGTQSYVRDTYVGQTASLPGNIVSWVLCGYSWAILTVPVRRFARGFSLDRLGWSKFFLIHIPVSVIASSVALGLYVVIATLLFGSRGSLYAFYENVFVKEFQSEILVYFLIVGVVTVYDRLFLGGADSKVTQHVQQPNLNGHFTTRPATNGNYLNGHSPEFLRRLPIKDNGRIAFVEIDTIHWIESYGNYLKIHTSGFRYIHRETMNAIEQKLDPQTFLRIRRSAIVRIDQVLELRPVLNGEFEVVLKGGTVLNSTRRYRKNLESLLRP